MNNKTKSAIAKRKSQVASRINPRQLPARVQLGKEFGRRKFDMTMRGNVTAFGGVALAAQLADHLGLREELDTSVQLLQRHRPYTDADHILSLAFASFCGARALDDLDTLREDEAYLDAIGMQRIPDPTTSGDFLRRFDEDSVGRLMEAINRVRGRCWEALPAEERRLARIDVDGTLVDTHGERKEGTDFNYKGGYGYAPMLVSLANTREPLYIRNQPGNRPSNDNYVTEVEAAIETVLSNGFEKARIRGDRAYAVSRHFDGWSRRGVEFVFSTTIQGGLSQELTDLPEEAWTLLSRETRPTKTNVSRARRPNVKNERVRERGYRTLRLEREDFTEIVYQPKKCDRSYRLVVVRKTISVTEGQLEFEDDVRYFGYITNIGLDMMGSRGVIAESNARCDQENLIEQMKNGVAAFTAPVGCIVSNWAWMIIASLPLTFQAWLSILHPDRESRSQIRHMQYRRFLRTIVLVPVRVVRQARGLSLMILAHVRNAELLVEGLRGLRSRASPSPG